MLATTENDLILEVPLIVRIRPVVVEPQSVLIVFDVEDTRIAVGIGFV